MEDWRTIESLTTELVPTSKTLNDLRKQSKSPNSRRGHPATRNSTLTSISPISTEPFLINWMPHPCPGHRAPRQLGTPQMSSQGKVVSPSGWATPSIPLTRQRPPKASPPCWYEVSQRATCGTGELHAQGPEQRTGPGRVGAEVFPGAIGISALVGHVLGQLRSHCAACFKTGT